MSSTPAPVSILTENDMNRYVENPADFSAECTCRGGVCKVARENFLFLDDGNELAAVGRLQSRCGHVVIIPDEPGGTRAVLYHTSCQRMSDVVHQIFREALEAPSSLPHAPSGEMTLGALYRRGIAIAYDHCKTRVARFGF